MRIVFFVLVCFFSSRLFVCSLVRWFAFAFAVWGCGNLGMWDVGIGIGIGINQLCGPNEEQLGPALHSSASQECHGCHVLRRCEKYNIVPSRGNLEIWGVVGCGGMW